MIYQVHGHNRVISHPRGKLLGGSSGINICFWTHASQKDINNWGELGNDGWSWDSIFPYFAKSETYSPPPAAETKEYDINYIDPSLHGTHGPVKDSFPPYYGDLEKAWAPTYKNLGITLNGDPKNGLALGPYDNLLALDPKDATRSFAATAYYRPNAHRPNLKVLTNALVNKVIFAPQKGHEPLVATGLCFTSQGKKYVASAKREVIVSAGTFQSPHLLELSGIGNKRLLKSHGIPVLKDNPNVGENLQDHILIPLGLKAAPGEATAEALRNPLVAEAVLETFNVNHTGPLSTYGPSAFLSYAQILSSFKETPHSQNRLAKTPLGGFKVPGLHKQHQLVLDKLLDPREATAQELYLAGGISPQNSANSATLFAVDPATNPDNYITFFGVLEHPFSRGTVHLTSPNPSTYPSINPNYLSHPYDILISSAITLHLQTLAQTSPLADKLAAAGTAYQPGYRRLTQGTVADHIRSSFITEYHPIGTCSMMPEREGGVVDARLKVYGTRNLRVVDASVFPLMVRGNLQTLVYAVAERAAEWILEDGKGKGKGYGG